MLFPPDREANRGDSGGGEVLGCLHVGSEDSEGSEGPDTKVIVTMND